MLSTVDLRRIARAAWDNAVIAYRFDMAGRNRSTYSASLSHLDDAWRAASLPLPWFPSMIARGDCERRC